MAVSGQPRNPRPSGLQLRDRWILVVDDDPALCRTLGRTLRGWGYETRITDRGRKALALCETEMPTLAIIDIMMPGMDGWQVSKKLLLRGGEATPPLVFMSATFEQEQLHPHAGVVATLPKPLDLERLRSVIEDALARRGRDELARAVASGGSDG